MGTSRRRATGLWTRPRRTWQLTEFGGAWSDPADRGHVEEAFNDLVDTAHVDLDEARHAESNAVLSLPMLKQSLEDQQAQGYRVVG